MSGCCVRSGVVVLGDELARDVTALRALPDEPVWRPAFPLCAPLAEVAAPRGEP